MTFTISKTKLAIATMAVIMLIPATAMATHVFDDVPDSRFYAEPVEWAFDNEITTGKTATTFAPDDNVTRGESVTFLKRYNDNIVEPAIAVLQDDIDSRPVAMFATIDSDGSVLSEFGLESSVRTSTGNYNLTFDRDVRGCAATTSDMIFLGTRDVDRVSRLRSYRNGGSGRHQLVGRS